MRAAFAALLILAWTAQAHALRIVTTTTDLASITESIGGDLVSVSSISTGRNDVHLLAAKPSYMVQANRADLWIRQGLELEIGFEPLVLEGARNPRIHVGNTGHLDASVGIPALDVPTAPVDRSMGDVHPFGNPHYQIDPYIGRIVAVTILDRMKLLAPEHAADFEANHAAFERSLDVAMFGEELVDAFGGDRLWALQAEGRLERFLDGRNAADGGPLALGGWAALMAPLRGERVVTYHRSWTYFAERFGLDIVGELEPKPGIPPTSPHLVEIVRRMQAFDVALILMEPFYSDRAPNLVAERTGARVVKVGNMVGSEPAASDYIAMIDNIVERVSAAFRETR